ncbi:MAG: response regulator [Flavobacterium sp.]|nr:response regulator [Flavobacterium sp.]
MIAEVQPKFERVMIIDDNAIDLYISSRLISKHLFGKKVLQYFLAQEALKYLQDNLKNSTALPQIIFVDIYMPGMSGFEFMEAYDKLPMALKNHCRVYIISSTIDCVDISRAQSDKNVVAFHVKPINKEILDSIITD